MTSSHTVRVGEQVMLPCEFQVVGKSQETPDTVTLAFERVGDGEVRFRPGQFMMIYVFGIGEIPISIAGNPHKTHELVLTVRAVGAVTDAICALEPGSVVGARGPYGSAWPLTAAGSRDLVIVTGGIGLAPLRPAIIEALNRRDEFRDLSLVYGARTPTDLLYKDDLLGWESSPDIEVCVTVDRAPSDWWGDVGVVTRLLPRVSFNPPNTAAFVCGPEVMMRVVARDLMGRGVPSQNIYLSLERNMKCGVGFCGHCQYGRDFLCRTGPIGSFHELSARMRVDEI